MEEVVLRNMLEFAKYLEDKKDTLEDLKFLAARLRKEGLSVEQAGILTGELSEVFQHIYLQGFKRGFNAKEKS